MKQIVKELQYSSGWSMCFVPCTRLTIQILDQHIRKQDGVQLSGKQMVWLTGIQMAFQPLLEHSNSKLVCYADPYCILIKNLFFAEVLLGWLQQHGDQVSGFKIGSHRAKRTSSVRRSHCLFGKRN